MQVMSYKFIQIPAGTISTSEELQNLLKGTYDVPAYIAQKMLEDSDLTKYISSTYIYEFVLSENELGYCAVISAFTGSYSKMITKCKCFNKGTTTYDTGKFLKLSGRESYSAGQSYCFYKMGHVLYGAFDGLLINPTSADEGAICSILGVNYRAFKFDSTSSGDNGMYLMRMSSIT